MTLNIACLFMVFTLCIISISNEGVLKSFPGSEETFWEQQMTGRENKGFFFVVVYFELESHSDLVELHIN